MLDFKDQPPELRKKSEKVQRIRNSNAHRIERLESMGVQFDTVVARVDHMLDQLCQMGIITTDQLLEIHLEWESSLQQQLDDIDKKMKELAEKARQAQGQKIAEIKKQLILPPGVVPSPNKE